MSHAFDVMARVFREKIAPHVVDEQLVMRFEMLIQDMHSANHNVPSADGIFTGDGVNKDRIVSDSARKLDEYVKENLGGEDCR